MDPATMAVLASVLGPMLSSAFGGGKDAGGALGLMQSPDVIDQLKRFMFGIGPNGTSDAMHGVLGLQYQQAIDKQPLQAAITRMAGKLLPRAYQPGVMDGLGGVNGDGMPPVLQRNGTTDGPSTTVHLSPPALPDLSNGGGGGDGRDDPSGRVGKQSLAPPTYAQLLQMVG